MVDQRQSQDTQNVRSVGSNPTHPTGGIMKKDIALHLREQSKRTDLPVDVIRTFSEAYAEIVDLEKKLSDCALDRLAQLDEELGL